MSFVILFLFAIPIAFCTPYGEIEKIEFVRQGEGVKEVATITDEGRIRDALGREHETLSRAAIELGKGGAYPGWDVWTAPGRGGRRLFDIREEFMKSVEKAVDE